MKTRLKPHTLQRRNQITTLALNIGLFAGLSALPLHAQDDENIPAGYTEDEWYDPGDWFDGNNIKPVGTDWWDNDGWANSADESYVYNPNLDDKHQTTNSDSYNYDKNRTTGSDSDGYGRNRKSDSDSYTYGRNRTTGADSQARRNQQQNRANNQARRNQQQNQSDRNQQAYGNQGSQMKKVSLHGTVDGFRKIDLKDSNGKSDQYTFVRVHLEDDESRVVSLGSRLILSDLDLAKGDQISVSGRNTRIDNRNVLVANSIEVDDKMFRVREQNRPNVGQQVSVKGTVKQSSETSLSDDSREKNLLIRLELKDGKSCVVDLGQEMTLSDLDIENGSEISLQGQKTKVDGKSLIIARSISVDGDKTHLRDKTQRKDKRMRGGDRMESRDYSDGDDRYNTLESVSRD